MTVLAFAVTTLAMSTVVSEASAQDPPSPAAPIPAAPRPATRTAPGPISHQGRWLTDAAGRVRLLAGINMVAKDRPPAYRLFTPAQMGFGADDAAFLAQQGFDVVRLGILPRAVMPLPGKIDRVYLRSFATTVRQLASHGLLVLVDLHQDQWSRGVCGGGFPDWATRTHGVRNSCVGFPLDYALNRATAQAFQSLWDDEVVAGRGLQDHVADMWGALAAAVGDEPGLLGYDLLNEPWSGTSFPGADRLTVTNGTAGAVSVTVRPAE